MVYGTRSNIRKEGISFRCLKLPFGLLPPLVAFFNSRKRVALPSHVQKRPGSFQIHNSAWTKYIARPIDEISTRAFALMQVPSSQVLEPFEPEQVLAWVHTVRLAGYARHQVPKLKVGHWIHENKNHYTSAIRRVRNWAQRAASSVSCDKPSAPYACIARSTTSRAIDGTIN